MRTFLRLKNQQHYKLPAEFQHEDIRYTEELVAHFLRQFTRTGDTVLDPFAGYGTTLIVAEAMERVPYGIEFDPRRASYIRTRLQRPAGLIHGDTRQILSYRLPAIDFSITSPPYMAAQDIEDPFTNYSAAGAGYAAYLRQIEQIYGDIKQLLKPEAWAVLEVSNLKDAQGITTLAWDVARAVSNVLSFEGEVVIGWDSYGYGYDHSYCLVFQNR
ncbi:MAG TPA: DNA methyltransferase [Roseiflexaceae bacterium]|nr:DNA methyltransferase [Roseiflexaceae bacterium]